MGNSHRLFISFSSDDNSSDKGKKGWVDDFTYYLSIFVQRINGEKVEITPLDNSSKGNAPSADDGIVILSSKSYLSKGLYKGIIPLIGEGQNVFKIDLDPIKKSEQPKEFGMLNEFRFFESVKDSDGQFITKKVQSDNQTFWLKIIDLAFDISRVIFKKTSAYGKDEVRTIYLAETSYDQVSNRDEIKRELQRHGHIVLPRTPFSGDLAELEKQVADCIAQADLTVQIIGEEYGEIVNNTEKSVVEVQNDLTNKHFGSENFSEQEMLRRLIWMPLNIKPKSDTQKLYLDKLRDDLASTAGAEIIQTPLEILKTVIHSRLQVFQKEGKARKSERKQRSDEKSVYLLFDKKDAAEVGGIVNSLSDKNIKVIVPDFSGQQLELLDKHREHLIQADGVLLYANKNLNWVNSKLNDVIKAPGFGRDYPFDAKGILIKDSSIPKEKIADFGDLIVLNGDSNKTDLGPFIDKFGTK